MKNLLRLEELAQFMACLITLFVLDAAWWWYLLLLLGPDIGMLGYLVNAQVGAFTYNLVHHKALPVLIGGLALLTTLDLLALHSSVPHQLLLTAIFLYGHASMDRVFGYGLKFGDSFQHTHLGWIGKGAKARGHVDAGR
jgi:hypothetical protein